MNAGEAYRRAAVLFADLCTLVETERDTRLAALDAEEAPPVMDALRSLLEQDEETFPELDGLFFEPLPTEPPPSALPAAIGGFRILREIGKGGMGIVYEAEQDHPRRRVAVKVIRGGATDPALVRRFIKEAESLARLSHEGIARIYGAGTDPTSDDRPWIAMEFVEGIPIDSYCAAAAKGPPDILALLARVCDAVEHAHQRGVVHRDLKPGNILVTQDGCPKLLDFGVARHLGRDDGATFATLPGQILGTLAYMSPEQAGAQEEGIDHRADVYSLGVIAYELLCGRLPIDLSGLPLAEAARRIRDEAATPIGRVVPALRGDVETIVGRALEKDPALRFESAAALGADVRRFLRNEPILARPHSGLYALRKFARRNPGLVAATAVALLALVAGTVVSIAFALDAKHAQRRAESAKRTAEGASLEAVEQARLARFEAESTGGFIEFLSKTLNGLDPALVGARELTLREAIDHVSAGVDDIESKPLVRARLHTFLGNMYRGLGRFETAEHHNTRAVALFEREDPASRAAAHAYQVAGWFWYRTGDLRRAETLSRRGLENLRGLGEGEGLDAALCLNQLGEVATQRREFEDARGLIEEALRIRLACLPPDHDDIAVSYLTLGDLAIKANRLDDAEAHHRMSVEMRRRLYPEGHALLAESLQCLSRVAYLRKDLAGARALMEEAVAIRERTLPAGHPTLGSGYFNLAVLELEEGDTDAAAAWLDRAEVLWRDAYGEGSPRMVNIAQRRAEIAFDRGDAEAGVAATRRSIALLEAQPEPDAFVIAEMHLIWGSRLWSGGDEDGACEPLERAFDLASALPDFPPTEMARFRMWAARTAERKERWDDVERLLAPILEGPAPEGAKARTLLQRALFLVGRARAAREDFAAAARVLRQARDLARELQDDEAEDLSAALLERSMTGAAKAGAEGAPVPSPDGR
jgi:tetratricopeptide (TPR) repeat protein